jgi:two-component system NtrC family sensor kinase
MATTADTQLSWTRDDWTAATPALPALDDSMMRLVLAHISTRVAVVNRDWTYRYANVETLRFMGLPPERVIGLPMSQVLDPGVYAALEPLFQRVFAGESLHRRGWAEYQHQGRRFRDQWFLPYRGADGEVDSVIIIGLDQTEQRLGEEALAAHQAQLRASEALKAAIFDHALAALVSTNEAGLIVEFNPAAEAMFGRPRAAVLGRPVAQVIVPPRLRPSGGQGLQLWRDEAEAGPARRMEVTAQRADGREFPAEVVLWRTEVDAAVVFTASITDLSERHAAAQQIERQRDALRQSEKLSAMGNLLAGVSHELNNPLAIVMGRAALLEEKCSADPALQRDAQLIREAAERCGRIVQTFLNMARSRPAQRSPVNLNVLARATAELMAYNYRSHGIELHLKLAESLPAVSADADQISQIVLNLLVNAQQALARNSAARVVTLSTGTTAINAGNAGVGQVELRVADNGPGVDAAARPRLFEAYFTTKGEGLGTGMGLAVSRTLARSHGGDLRLDEAAPGGGAAFCLTLPALAMPAPASQPSVAAPVAEANDAADARILVVDDEEEVALMMREMLEHAGYDVATAESGALALEMLAEARFDVVVSDLHMPDMDGASLWREIRSRHPALEHRLLFVTGDTLSPLAQEFFKASGCAGMDKPFSRAQLLARVQALQDATA